MHNRKSIRLKNYDYSDNGFYFLTICTWNRECIFGEVIEDKVQLNNYGKIVLEELERSIKIRKEIIIDVFTIMPNHIHCIIVIENNYNNINQNCNDIINVIENKNCQNMVDEPDDIWINEYNIKANNNIRKNGYNVGANKKNVGANKKNVGANGRSPLHMKPQSLSSFVAGFKSIVTSRINELRNTPGHPVWQRNYYEHIIRDGKSLQNIRQYILNNPLQWNEDKDNPDNL